MVFKRRLVEVPELGISLESCLGSAQGVSISDMMERQAQQAVALLVSREEREAKTQSDRSLFLEVVSAGMRQVTAEQTAQSLRNAALLASERSGAAFRRLFSLIAHEQDAKTENPAILQAAVESVDPLLTADTCESQAVPSQASLANRKELSDEEAEIGMRSILAKGIEYQVASRGYSELSSARALKEAELSLELLRSIEHREALLSEAMVESSKVSLSFRIIR